MRPNRYLLTTAACWAVVVMLAHAQKPALQLREYPEWQRVNGGKLSDDGRFVWYTIGNDRDGQNLFISSTEKNAPPATIIRQCYQAEFTPDSKAVLYVTGDTLHFSALQTGKVIFNLKFSTYQTNFQGIHAWLAWTSGTQKDSLHLTDLLTGKVHQFAGVAGFSFSTDKSAIFVLQKVKAGYQALRLALQGQRTDTLWQGREEPRAYALDAGAGQMAARSGAANTFLLVNAGETKSITIPDSLTGHYRLSDEVPLFSADGLTLIFGLKITGIVAKTKLAGQPDVWNYKDPRLKPEELLHVNEDTSRTFSLAYHVSSRSWTLLERNLNEHLLTEPAGQSGHYILVQSDQANTREADWNQRAGISVYCRSLQDGRSRTIATGISRSGYARFSTDPSGQVVVWYNAKQLCYQTYEVKTGRVRQLNNPLLPKLSEAEFGNPQAQRPYGMAGWLGRDQLIVYSRYDLWVVPLNGSKPYCLSGLAGQKKLLVLRLAGDRGENLQHFTNGDTLLLSAFSTRTKANGFYRVRTGMPGILEAGKLSATLYSYEKSDYLNIFTMPPVKARRAQLYLVQNQDAGTSPNLYLTSDLINFRPLTDVHPEKAYNWLTVRMLRWKNQQGLLYLPENFNPRRKYPLIIHPYEERSNKLHAYFAPQLSNGDLNIPWYVSNGYIVYEPDINYRIGSPLTGAQRTIIAAANHLKELSFIDFRRIGLQGISFGASEINITLTRTHLFAAAAESAGKTDQISAYNGVLPDGFTEQPYYEGGQGRMGKTLWQDTKAYLDQSPVLQADRVTTPLLIQHNKTDPAVPFSQAVEWYTALRRQGKPVWLLQYDGEGHGLADPANQLDYTIRLAQFFNHYLKNAPAPRWLTIGVPSRLKGIETGLEQ